VARFQGAIQNLRNFFGGKQEEMEVKRYKRDTGDDMLDDFVFGDRTEFKKIDEKEEQEKVVSIQKIEISSEKEEKHEVEVVSSDIDEALLSEASSHHKIRHIHEKISHLSPDHQLVVAVLDNFCVISPCPSMQCPVCSANNSTQCLDNNNNIENSNNTTKDENTNNNNNKTSGCPVVSCPTGHMKHQFPHTYTHEHPQFGKQPIPASPIVCSTSTEVIVIILLTSFTNFIVFTILFFCFKAKENFREELMADEEEDNENDEAGEEDNRRQDLGAKSLKSIQRRYSFSDIGYNQSPKYTVLEEYGFVV